jgi:hypothetical protein
VLATNCDGTCANLSSDEEHCGTCDNACDGLESCDGGSCRCPAPTVGAAVRLTNNAQDDLRPSAAWDGTHVGVAYARTASDGLSDLRFALLDANGAVIADNLVSGSVRCDPSNSTGARPSLVWTGTEYGVLWRSTQIYFTRLHPDGTPKSEPVALGNHYAPSLAYSRSGATSAMGFMPGNSQVGFQLLGADAMAPGVPNIMASLGVGPRTDRADGALLVLPDGNYVFAFRLSAGFGMAVFNADGSRTLPWREVPGSLAANDYGTDWPSLAQRDGTVYAAWLSENATRLNLNRGLQAASVILSDKAGVIVNFVDPHLAVVGDSLAVAVMERLANVTGHRMRLHRYALPATGTPVELHDSIEVVPLETVSGAGNSLVVATSDHDLLAIWVDERWGTLREIYAAPINLGACP